MCSHAFLFRFGLERTLCRRIIQGYVEALGSYLYRILFDVLQFLIHIGTKEVFLRLVRFLALCDCIQTSFYLLRKCRDLVDTYAAGIVDTIQNCTVARCLECLRST